MIWFVSMICLGLFVRLPALLFLYELFLVALVEGLLIYYGRKYWEKIKEI